MYIILTQLLLAVSSDDETADVSIQFKDTNPIQHKREYQEDNTNLKHEITQLIIHIYTNVSANNIQFLNISNYEKHVTKSLYKDKGYVHSAIKHLILCLAEFIKVRISLCKDQYSKSKSEYDKLFNNISNMKCYLDKIFKPVFEYFEIKGLTVEYIINSVWKEVHEGNCTESLWYEIKKNFNLIKKHKKRKSVKEW